MTFKCDSELKFFYEIHKHRICLINIVINVTELSLDETPVCP